MSRRGEKPSRRTLTTPSWAEALRIATTALEGFNPEIAAARAEKQKAERQRVSVEDACQLWLDRVAGECGRTGAYPTYHSLTKKFIAWATGKGFLCIQDVTTLSLSQWSSSKEWTKYADLTRQQRWAGLRNMFAHLTEVGVLESNPILTIKPIRLKGDQVQGPYTEEQVKVMFAHVQAGIRVTEQRRQTIHVRRLHVMMTLLLRGGCDLIDAVSYEPSQIERMMIDGREVSVYRYHRSKTGVLAVVPLSDDVVKVLHSVPMLVSNSSGMPFRSRDTAASDARRWSRCIARVLKAAGVEYVELPGRDQRGRPRRHHANPKQLRHTFAVNQLKAGQRPETVARMLGHVDTTMIRKHYAPWVKELDEAHVREVVNGWGR
jgi:integrase